MHWIRGATADTAPITVAYTLRRENYWSVRFALPAGSTDRGDMFTLEDVDLHGCAADLATHLSAAWDEPHPSGEADARLHPTDYFIVGA